MKGSKFGYILGLIIGIPLFAYGVNHFFFKGNNATDIEVNVYLQNSKIETFTVDKWIDDGYEQYVVGLQRGANSAALHWFTFYDKSTGKYFNLYMFSYLENNQQGSQRVSDLRHIKSSTTFTAFINQDQLKSLVYGTKDNPVPAWGEDLLEYNGNVHENIEREAKTFHISPETNAIFIQQYLSRFMPKDEYKVMFKK
ncbi:hypothetical protein EG359_19970 [Chryseobacterium joostei]|uniref:DUF8188 domain-containing protein n=1 Tax=Chryseobacterium joostei TaxID=112234 RepID=A0A1N7J5Y8_9FLAO|nr:hypothetical protein [Chryseobacterium joostei]AZB01740.1 hypothetical protein EG359_19970 [Chryseobacterium joostei]SIS44773.1 hypothetical protein SAMN05421768_107366 [Chryseobacterium joostei]